MKTAIFLPLVLVLSACIIAPPPPQKTQLEIRELQTRSYDTKDVKMVIKAVMHALQDDNFMIKQADADLGLLTAQKEVEVGGSSFDLVFGPHSERRVPNNAITEASANISEFGDQTRVRINFQYKVMDNRGATMQVERIDDVEFYQQFFSKVAQAVFLGQEKLQ